VPPIALDQIGKTKVVPEREAAADYSASAGPLAKVADYLVVNVSSPKTPGLRKLHAIEHLRLLLTVVRDALDAASDRRVPLLVKIAPDLVDEDIDAIADLVMELDVDGIIATNTTISRDHLASDPAEAAAVGAGGLSGAPLNTATALMWTSARPRRRPADH
jgi:dihydroorotate dehydrogenase